MTEYRKTVVIAGHYGFGNPGDEAILAAIVADLRALRPGLRLTVISGDPAETEAAHNVGAVSWTDIEAITRTVASSDLLILGGGGLFHDYWDFDPAALLTRDHTGLAYFGGLPLLAATLDKPVMLYAVGVGPLKREAGRQLTRTAFELASLATVRDRESKRQLKAIGVRTGAVHITADPAFRCAPAEAAGIQRMMHANGLAPAARPLVGAALRNWDIGVAPKQWERQVAGALDDFLEWHGGAALLVPFWDSRQPVQHDLSVAERVRGQMRNAGRACVAPEGYSPMEKAGLLGQCDLVLGMRLHSLIFAIRSGVPVVGLVYDPKVRALMERAGCAEYAVDLRSVTAQRLANAMGRAYRHRAALAKRLRQASNRMAGLAHENARLAVDLLEKSAPRRQPATAPDAQALKAALLSHTLRLAAQQAVIDRLTLQTSQRDQRIANLQAELQTKVGERDKLIGDLQTELQMKVGARDRLIAELQAAAQARAEEWRRAVEALETELRAQDQARRQQVADLNALLSSHAAAAEELRARLAEREKALLAIHASRHWKAMSYYWGALDRLRSARAGLRRLARRLLPFSIRRRWVSLSRRMRSGRAPAPPPIGDLRPAGWAPHAGLPPTAAQYDVICFPIIEWDFRFQRPQQLLTWFAREGHRCFYVHTRLHSAGPDARIEKIAENIFGLRLPGPAHLNLYTDRMEPEAVEQCLSALDGARENAEMIEVVCLVELPFWAPLALAARKRWGWRIIYDCMDEHAGFSTNGRDMLQQEEALLRESDLVLAASRRLHEKAAAHARSTLLLPNAADYAHFSQPLPADPLAGLGRPIIGYFGAIAEWFDVETVRAAAVSRPDWRFVLIGDTGGADVSRLRPLPNVHLLGEKPYAELPAYLRRFDVACIPFRFTPLTLATNPVKFYEYLSAGKPVVAAPLPELEPLQDYFYPVRRAADFVPQIEAALAEDSPERARQRMQFASLNTWGHRLQAIKPAIQGLYGKAAIVIVSFNNLAHLRLCLESLWAKTIYPNYEVIVVDNGSEQELIEYLRAGAEREPRLKVILNGENLGFARANNIGIAAAGDCEYVVLLNDDTVVTRGWLATLVRHLQAPDIALVGPVTNFAGNEAQIELGYDDLEAMERCARRYTRKHAGGSFEIPMLAMFCVGMRRAWLDRIGPLDERFGPGLFEDDDFSLRARRAGGRLVCAEDIFVHHWGKTSFGRMDQDRYDRLFAENRRKFEDKWGQKWRPHQARMIGS